MLRAQLCTLMLRAVAWLAPPFSEGRQRCKFRLFVDCIAGAAHLATC